MEVIKWIGENIGTLLQGLLALLGAFSIIAKLTPTDADDAFIRGLLKAIHSLGLTKKKEG